MGPVRPGQLGPLAALAALPRVTLPLGPPPFRGTVLLGGPRGGQDSLPGWAVVHQVASPCCRVFPARERVKSGISDFLQFVVKPSCLPILKHYCLYK